jgi:release factor glutamine methyltransferase
MAADIPLDDGTSAAFERLVERRERGEPVAYLVGSAGFYGRTFLVDERVLVPRPESEHVIEAVIDDLRARRKTGGIVVDVGTGSGALGITLACELPDLAVYATDISADALSVARRNAARNAVFQRCTFLAGDLLEPLVRFGERVDAVVANLPYIPAADVPRAPNPAGFEPRVALDGGPDGLSVYRRLLDQIDSVAADDAVVFLEAAPGTIEPLSELVEQIFPAAFIEIGEDYAGLERYVTFVR